MHKYHAIAAVLSLVAGVPAHAETALTGRADTALMGRADTALMGKWVGPFNGIQVEIPVQPGPFEGTSQKIQGPRFTQNTLTIEFDTQKQGLSAGTWNAAEFRQRFVCAQTSDSLWSCVDSGGRASVEVKSATEIKVCYLDNRQGAQGAGCATLRKTS